MADIFGAVRRLFRPRAESGSITTSQELADVLIRSGLDTASGVTVTPAVAMQLIAVNACVRVLAETVAQIPLILYRRSEDGKKERATDHPLWPVLHDKPNGFQTSYDWREQAQSHLALRGNAYALKVKAGGQVRELIPLNPDKVTPEQAADYSITYKVGGEARALPASDVLHLHGLAFDGVLGVSPIRQAREAIGLSLNAEAFGGRLFGNSSRPSGLLTTDNAVPPEQMARVAETWAASVGGSNSLGTAVVDNGWKFTPLTMDSKDAQFLETRKFQVNEIARLFRVPPHMIGDLDKATFSNIEQQSLDFVTYTMLPWLRRWETSLGMQLLTDAERASGMFIEFLLDGLLRADTITRYGAYSIGLRDGWLNRNEVRAKENLNPIEGGDEYQVAANVFGGTTAGEEPNETDPDSDDAAA